LASFVLSLWGAVGFASKGEIILHVVRGILANIEMEIVGILSLYAVMYYLKMTQ
jgi:hypothetical protein